MPRLASSFTRTLVVCGLIAATAIAVNAGSTALAEMERADIGQADERLKGLEHQATALVRAISLQALALDDYLLQGNAVDAAHYRDAVAEADRIGVAMRAPAQELPGVAAALEALEGATQAWQDSIAAPALAAPTRLTGVSAGGAGASANLRAPIEREVTSLYGQLADADDALGARDAGLTQARLTAIIIGLISGIAATLVALYIIRRFGRSLARDARRGEVVNRFTESTAFSRDDKTLATSNLQALGLLVEPDASVVHILNRSQDRAVPEASFGDAIAEVLTLKALGDCPGISRGSTVVTTDASLPLGVRCPVYPVEFGTLACVPLISGESVGAVHLYWVRPDSLPLRMVADVNRLAQLAALAIGNRRLLAALQGQASTDARTGLANSRAFDQALETELVTLHSGGSLAVLMLDLDHFKDFNDRQGHPAGDEALRVFATVLRSCVRDNDLAARYGGEEFTVLLRGLDLDAAMVVAERIRLRTEATVIPLGPGITDRVTISIGVATAPEQGADRVALLRAADEALYMAKNGGRNQVAHFAEKAAPLLVLPAAAA